MANIIKITLEADDKTKQVFDNLQSGAKKAGDSIQGMAGSLRLIKWDAIVNLGRQAIQTATAIYNMARSTASAAEQIARQAEITGVTTEEIQKLQYAAKMCNVSNDELAMGLKFLSRNMGDAIKGTGEARYYFEALGITMEDLQSKSPVPMLLKIADAFARTDDPAKKVEYTLAMFGRTGDNLIQMLSKGGAGINAYGDELVRMGSILGDVVIKKGSEADNQFKRLEARMNALKISAAPTAVAIAEAAEMLFESIKWAIEKTGSVVEPVLGVIYKILKALGIAKAEAKETGESLDLAVSHKPYGERYPAKKGGLPAVMTDEMRRQQVDLARERLTTRIEEIKAEEALEIERIKTQLALLERSWKQNLISEEDYLGRKKDLEGSAFQFSIALSAKETDAIVLGYKEIIKWLSIEAEKAKAREERERELGRIRSENLLKAEQLAQIGIKGSTELLELTRQLTIAESEGRLKVTEEEINKQKELNDMRVGLGILRPGQAALEELDATKKITEEKIRHLELQRSIEPGAEKQTQLTGDILALNIQLENVEKRRLRLLPEFGTFQEGWKNGLQQYLVSLGSTFQQAADLAKRAAQSIQQSFSDFFFDAFQNKIKSARDYFQSFINSIYRILADFLAKKLIEKISQQLLSTGSQSRGDGNASGLWGGIVGVIGSVLGAVLKHEGGIVGEPGPTRSVPLTAFAFAPRFHTGFMPEEYPAILKKGEGVFTPDQMKGLGKTEISNTYNIDARGSQKGVSTEIMRAIKESENRAVVRSVNQVADSKLRGGKFAKIFKD
jgi:hypothetical protein